MYCGTWFYTASYGCPDNEAVSDLVWKNSFCFPYPSTYTVVPYSKAKIARIMVYPYIDSMKKEIWPIDPRTICLNQLRELKSMGYELLSAFEHEFQLLHPESNKPLWNGKEYCSQQSFSFNEDIIFDLERNLYKMGVDTEVMHMEYSPGQLEMAMIADWGIYGADNSFTLRSAVKQIAQKNSLKATFATTPFPASTEGASNGAHFNFSLWTTAKNMGDDDAKDVNLKKENAFYDEKGEIGLSEMAMYFIGGILEHIDGITIFANITQNCYRRSNIHSWSPGNVTWGRNNRTALVRVKTDGKEGTYMEYRLPASACNPYMVTASVLAAGIDGIKNKIKPKYKECTKDAFDKEYEKIPLLAKNLQEAIEGLKKDKIIWNAFGDQFCTMLVNTKELELKELKELAEKLGQEEAETKMFLNI